MKQKLSRGVPALFVLIALLGQVAPSAAQVLAQVQHMGTVEVGTGEWWDGARVQNTTMFWEACDTHAQTACYHYSIDVPEGGSRLRIALDYEDRESRWAFRVRPPGDGAPIVFDPSRDAAGDNLTTGWTTIEAALPNADHTDGTLPVAGRYIVSVAPVSVIDDTFRMRAVLDGAHQKPDPGTPAVPLLPNAQVVPPYNFSFDAPIDAQSWSKPPSYSDVGRQQSCSEDEKHVDGATECLRFAAGGFNTGQGPLAINWDAGETTSGTATQTIQWSDGTTTTKDAGTFVFHPQHRHFHYQDAMQYRLFQVVSDRPTHPHGKEHPVHPYKEAHTEEVGIGNKTSYCMVDYFIADWYSIDQHYALGPGAVGANCGSVKNRPFVMVGETTAGRPGTEYKGTIGWSKGYGDVYPYWRQGQYVEFKDAPGDGLYVVQTSFDEFLHLKEMDETDNKGYALIEITGYGTPDWHIETLERGFGASPWDENKQIIGLDEWTWT